jgi:hypothetical protein
MFPVRYELHFYIAFRRNSVFKELNREQIWLRANTLHVRLTCVQMLLERDKYVNT